MKHSILVIDDEKVGAQNLQKFFLNSFSEHTCNISYDEIDIKRSIQNLYYDIAIVDLRMDNFSFNGFDIIKEIIEINPFAKIIIISAYTSEFQNDINEVLNTGKISAILTKEKFDIFKEKLQKEILKIFTEKENKVSFTQAILYDMYLEAKNEDNTKIKGNKFERFVSFLFGNMGFHNMNKRVIDKSLNEVDLIVRNETNDKFLNSISPYFLIECKNTIEKIDKNVFIIFEKKLNQSNNLAKIGFIITPNGFKRTAYLEALRGSNLNSKIIFISNVEIEKLINSINILDTFKKIIDDQVKDN